MFAIEIITKLAEYTLGDLGKKIISRGSDPKRKFAKDLLSCYQATKDYRRLCNELLESLEKRRREPFKSERRHEIYEVQKISDRIAESVEVIVGKFSFQGWNELYDEILYGQASNEKAKKRYDILEIYDPNLAALLKHATASDIWIAGIASQLSRVKADWYTQQIIILNPDTTNISEALDAYNEAVNIVRWGKTLDVSKFPKYLTVLGFNDNDDLVLLIQTLRQNIFLIDNLVEAMAKFMKSNFVFEDLL